ncbi:hypothetical protein Csa_005040 [Cucumis sativus]|uniref:Calmodulin-binding domain-containing protein n=1 Tax=Cucumis sativus TaxID=3659 RepID=A0A0A0KCA4_CUCSA|nr:hypothetical protein Csa_005040 [Cucumis sativus]
MENKQKRKGFIRRLYRAARSAGKAKVKQSNPPTPSTSPNSGDGDDPFANSSETKSASNPNRPVAATTVQKQASSTHHGAYGGYGGGDENVDVKAATYILLVKERLKMERSMDRRVLQSTAKIYDKIYD